MGGIPEENSNVGGVFENLAPDEMINISNGVPTPVCDGVTDCFKKWILPGSNSATVSPASVTEKLGIAEYTANQVVSAKNSLADSLNSGMNQLTSAMNNFDSTINNTIKDQLTSFGNSAKDAINSGIDKLNVTVKDKITSIGNSVKNKIDSLDGKTINFDTKYLSSRKDKRVSLTACPITSNFKDEQFSKKIVYLLGGKKYEGIGGIEFYGFLRNSLGPSSGLIFPYTPSIQVSNQVNYDSAEIIHSNLSYNYYKNTNPPSYNCSAKFTADNKANALHMLSAIWFFTACTKCDFGERSANPGLPPPILYLNGYNQMMDNIPVVIESFDYKLQDDKQYVNLLFDISKDFDTDGIISTYVNTTTFTFKSSTLSFVEEPSKFNDTRFSYWLPMELTLSFKLKVQPNLLKVKKQWSLEGLKTGSLMVQNNKFKNPALSYAVDSTIFDGFIVTDSNGNVGTVDKTDTNSQISTPGNHILDVKESDSKTKTISFIPSGWTW